ncbi:translation initiation factor IF-2 [Botrimarina sp.]|uniref:translation initiation factor IF-2 n=1 Tax=Botrimarina sp. TaxID=2795802 RepID=UPI0032EFFE4A
MRRPTGDQRGGKIRTITAPKAGRSALRRDAEASDSPSDSDAQEAAAGEAAEQAPADVPAAQQPPVAPAQPTPSQPAATSEAPEAQSSTPAEAGAEDRAAAVAEAGEQRKAELAQPGPLARIMGRGGGKMPVIGAGQGGGQGGKRKSGENAPKPRPVVKLAAIPAQSQPKEDPKRTAAKDEAPAQKPDMKLPAEVLGGKQGAKPLAHQLKRAERTLEAAKLKEREETPAAKGRGRRSAETSVPMLGGREQRQLSRNRSGGRANLRPRRMSNRRRRSGVNTAAPRKDRISVQLPCTVKELSEAAGVPAVQILRILMEEGVMTNINAVMDPELTELVAADLGVDIDFVQEETLEDKFLTSLDEQEDAEESLEQRAPVVTFLGHVDHGKTSLLDKLIGIDVVSREDGGITQHIRAYQLENNGSPVSFVDTPGHEAFTEMRARGAGVTDIVVLVVAADDGVMPQTEEAIAHAKAAGVPIVVALNKIDLPGADANKAMQGLAANDLLPSEWGGDVEVVKTSAVTGEGLDALLETLLTVAELNEYKANPDRPAIGACLESQQDADAGVMAKVLIQRGTLRVGDTVVCGDAYGKVKAMQDPLNPSRRLLEAGPSVPVDLSGLNRAPSAGQRLYVLDDIADAREIADARAHQERTEFLGSTGFQAATLETLFDRLDGVSEIQTLNLILRADVRGSIEAIEKELAKLDHPEVRLRILQRSVGGVTEGDVVLADASDAVIIAFNVVPDDKARAKADQLGVEIRRYGIIYKVADDLKLALEGMLRPEQREVELGRVLVQMTFKISRVGVVAGCRVLQGVVERNARVRVIRENTILGEYPIDTLRREKDDVKEVREGYECGIKLSGFNDIKEADLLEVYKVEEVTRSFDD